MCVLDEVIHRWMNPHLRPKRAFHQPVPSAPPSRMEGRVTPRPLSSRRSIRSSSSAASSSRGPFVSSRSGSRAGSRSQPQRAIQTARSHVSNRPVTGHGLRSSNNTSRAQIRRSSTSMSSRQHQNNNEHSDRTQRGYSRASRSRSQGQHGQSQAERLAVETERERTRIASMPEGIQVNDLDICVESYAS